MKTSKFSEGLEPLNFHIFLTCFCLCSKLASELLTSSILRWLCFLLFLFLPSYYILFLIKNKNTKNILHLHDIFSFNIKGQKYFLKQKLSSFFKQTNILHFLYILVYFNMVVISNLEF